MPRSRSRRPRASARATLALALVAASGCNHYRPTQTGYLGDYSRLEKDPFHINHGIGFQRARTRDATHEAAGAIDSFSIEPVEWLVDPASRAGQTPGRREALSASLDEALRDQLGRLRPIVDRPGPRTARIRSAITTVRLSRPILNVLLTATYFTPLAIGPVFFGGGAVEAEAIGPDGRQLAAVTSASSGGWIDLIGFYSRSGHAHKAMRRNAKELREALDH